MKLHDYQQHTWRDWSDWWCEMVKVVKCCHWVFGGASEQSLMIHYKMQNLAPLSLNGRHVCGFFFCLFEWKKKRKSHVNRAVSEMWPGLLGTTVNASRSNKHVVKWTPCWQNHQNPTLFPLRNSPTQPGVTFAVMQCDITVVCLLIKNTLSDQCMSLDLKARVWSTIFF